MSYLVSQEDMEKYRLAVLQRDTLLHFLHLDENSNWTQDTEEMVEYRELRKYAMALLAKWREDRKRRR